MKRILSSLGLALAFFALPHIASAASCQPSHTFTTGETLTQANLNSNPITFAGCFNNIDNTNIGSAGLFASQLKPTSLSQAQFAGNQTYTFPAATTGTVPLRIGGLGGQTADLLDIEATVGGTIFDSFNATGQLTVPLLTSIGNVVVGSTGTGEIHQTENGYSVNYYIDNLDNLRYYDATHLHDSGFALNMNTGAFSASSISILNGGSFGNVLTTNGIGNTGTITSTNNISSSQGVSAAANVTAGSGGNGEFHQTENGYSVNYYIDNLDNFGIFDATHGTLSGFLVNAHTGAVITNGITDSVGITSAGLIQYKPSSTSYVLAYDANSTSASVNTHYEHNSATTAAFSGGFACTGTIPFQHTFSANPDITMTLLGFSGTTPITLYTNTRNTSGFQACAYENGAASGTVSFSWIATGE